MKRLLTLFMVALMPLSAPQKGDLAPGARCAVLMEAETGAVLFAKNESDREPMASTAKVMTALVAIENYSLSEQVSISLKAAQTEGSSAGLEAGESASVEELLLGLMLASGNDAACALAGHCGSERLFVEMMNEKAALLGLENTSYSDPSGLEGERAGTTALDLARLLAYAMQVPDFARLTGTRSATVCGRPITNHNRLLWMYPGVDGGKTGYTVLAGRTLVTTAVRDGRRLVAATLNDPSDWDDHKRMYDWGFAQTKESTDGKTAKTSVLSGHLLKKKG